MHSRIERIARQGLRMRPPEAGRVKIIEPAPRLSGQAGQSAGQAEAAR
jgi:hypothetical protein